MPHLLSMNSYHYRRGGAEAVYFDHAALFETTLLGALWPERVQLERLPSLAAAPSIDPDGHTMGPHRHDPAHPLYGIFGPDPRRYDPSQSEPLLEEMVGWVIARVRGQTL